MTTVRPEGRRHPCAAQLGYPCPPLASPACFSDRLGVLTYLPGESSCRCFLHYSLLCWELVRKPNQFYGKNNGSMKNTTVKTCSIVHCPPQSVLLQLGCISASREPAPGILVLGWAQPLQRLSAVLSQQFLSWDGTSNRLRHSYAGSSARHSVRHSGLLTTYLCSNSQHFFSSKQITVSILPTLSKYIRDKQHCLCSAAMAGLCSYTWDALLTCRMGQFQVMLSVPALNNPLSPLCGMSHNHLLLFLQLHSKAQQPSTTDSCHTKCRESCRAHVSFTVRLHCVEQEDARRSGRYSRGY